LNDVADRSVFAGSRMAMSRRCGKCLETREILARLEVLAMEAADDCAPQCGG